IINWYYNTYLFSYWYRTIHIDNPHPCLYVILIKESLYSK
ncbi:unnamed protein product, partial [marine sediment metagenome]